MAAVTAKDFLIDLGSGDGRNVIAAAKRGARALGVEFNPDMVALSERNAKAAGSASLSPATVARITSSWASFASGDALS